ncbi:hypothetical protein BX600DRAFT_468862 [Xylariales sp. PMI_506]|nr:hypothetical protein BX600DRAFT_468862 [Xylariales sp. PMI_506]
MAAARCPELHFVVSTDIGKPTPEVRKFIRSHVMQGKNLGTKIQDKTSSPSKGAKHRSQSANSPSLSANRTSKRKSKAECDASFSSSEFKENLTCNPYPVEPRVPVPRRFGSDAAIIGLGDAVDSSMVEAVLRFTVLSKNLFFPIKATVLAESKASRWLEPLVFDSLYLHFMLFTSQYYIDAMSRSKANRQFHPSNQPRAWPHFLKTLSLLRERLENGSDRERISDSTTSVVMGLAGHAMLMDDFKAAQHHLDGLFKIVNLRGGPAALRTDAKLLIEIIKCDMAMALHTGSPPIIFSNSESNMPPGERRPATNMKWPLPIQPWEIPAQHKTKSWLASVQGIDTELASTWGIMSQFCSMINWAAASGQRLSAETFLDAMVSVMYRLVQMRFAVGSIDEAIRLGILSLSCNVFIQGGHLGGPYTFLKSAFRDSLEAIASGDGHPQLVLWLSVVGAISVFDIPRPHEAWLRDLLLSYLKLCGMYSWGQLKELLDSFIWISIHDNAGKEVYESIITH